MRDVRVRGKFTIFQEAQMASAACESHNDHRDRRRFLEPSSDPLVARPNACVQPHHGAPDGGTTTGGDHAVLETPPSRWTKVELKCRRMELREEHLEPEKMARPSYVTEYQKMVKQLNVAGKTKLKLVEYCTQQLKIPVQSNDTMQVLHKKAMEQICLVTKGDGQDLMRFKSRWP